MDRKYAMILGNLGNTRDRFCSGYKNNPSASEMLQQAVHIPYVTGIELVGTWDIDEQNVGELKSQMTDLGLACVSIIPDTLLLVQETGKPNVGVTIDNGHAYVAGEVVGESIVLARRAGNKLFHMHFNDNHASWDDDMIVGTVHSITFLETLYWLDRTGYDGWFSMDQYPYREDGAGVIGESILWLARFDEILPEYRSEIDRLIAEEDAIQTSWFLRKALLKA